MLTRSSWRSALDLMVVLGAEEQRLMTNTLFTISEKSMGFPRFHVMGRACSPWPVGQWWSVGKRRDQIHLFSDHTGAVFEKKKKKGMNVFLEFCKRFRPLWSNSSFQGQNNEELHQANPRLPPLLTLFTLGQKCGAGVGWQDWKLLYIIQPANDGFLWHNGNLNQLFSCCYGPRAFLHLQLVWTLWLWTD